MPNLVGRALNGAPPDPQAVPPAARWTGPVHAVAEGPGRAAREANEQVQAFCGEWVEVVAVEDLPDDTGLCQACQYPA
jgi:hypothetical protein